MVCIYFCNSSRELDPEKYNKNPLSDWILQDAKLQSLAAMDGNLRSTRGGDNYYLEDDWGLVTVESTFDTIQNRDQ